MSDERSQNVQEIFLNSIRKEKIPVTVFLINGVIFTFMTTILAIILFLPLFLVLLVIIEIEKICHTIF